MLKWAFVGCRFVSRSDDDCWTNVTPTSCGPAVTVVRNLRCASAVRCPVSSFGGSIVEQLHAFAIDQHFHLVRLVEPFDVLVAVAHQPDFDFVRAVARKFVRNECAAPRAQRQTVDVLLLRQVGPQADRRSARRFFGAAQRETADVSAAAM